MREILFRGKRKVCDEWVYGFPFISRKGEYKIKWYDGYYGSSKTSEIYAESIGQFTGVTTNGKKIFEGDIVKGLFLFGMEIMAVVVFKDGAFGLQWNRGEVTEFSAFTSLCNVQYEVVGNIHDNPELIGGETNGT